MRPDRSYTISTGGLGRRFEDAPMNFTNTLSILDQGLGELVACELNVEVLQGPDLGVKATIADGYALIGQDAGAQIKLTDPTVSRRHAELRAVADGILVVDLESKNGTRIGGVAVQQALLTAEGTFAVGGTLLRVHRKYRPIANAPGTDSFGGYLTRNPKLSKALSLLERAAKSEATILLEGETGTGKELLARGIHDHSSRKDSRYMVVDCGSITSSLLESQLFGHRRGAFTGATEDVGGAFESATGGTVFLDELGELPLDLQPKLLRALESRTIRRVGDSEDRAIDVRFVAATNRDLKQMVEEGTFRKDLYYRVAVVKIDVPPLRDRPEDVPLLAAHYASTLATSDKVLAPETFAALSHYDWPGNARELRNVIQRAMTVAEGERIAPDDLFPSAGPARTFHEAKDHLIASFEERYVRALLERHKGNVSRAAKEAGLSRNALYALMKRAGIHEPSS